MSLPHDDAPSVIETTLIHEGQRRATSLLVDLLEVPPGRAAAGVPAAAVAELRDFVVASLVHHHRLEDDDLWPTLVAADAGLSEPLGRLSDEHEQLDAALADLAAADIGAGDDRARHAATAVRDLVHRHLAGEEPVLFPALRARVSDDEWAAFSQRATASAPPVGTHLLVGFLDEVGTDDQVGLIFRHLPPPALESLPAARLQGREAVVALTSAAGRTVT